MNGLAAAVSAVVLVVVVSAWPAAALVVLVATALDRRPTRPAAAQHRCAGEGNAPGCSHIHAADLVGQPRAAR